MKSEPELTIVSVYHDSYTRRLIELNEELVRKLNPSAKWIWLAGDNSLPETVTGDSNQRSSINDKERFFKPEHAGILDRKKFKTVRSYGYTFNSVSHGKFWAAYSEADGLRQCFKEVRTRFLVVLDNDFYIVRPAWIDEILCYMTGNGLAIFGAPYYPADYAKFRYFPSAPFCMFADLEKVSVSSLDFNPRFHLLPNTENEKTKKALFPLFSIKLRKALVGSSPDCGYNIFERYYSDPDFNFECLNPVYNPFKESGIASKLGITISRFFEYFLPDRLAYIPKKSGYYTNQGFGSCGYFEVRSRGWQEHMWKGRPFGFHIRGMRQRKDHGFSEDEIIKSVADTLQMYAK